MSTNNDGGPAFPHASKVIDDRGHELEVVNSGMSLRDFFAAVALHGIFKQKAPYTYESPAIEAYRYADAMLAARERKGKK